MSPDDPRHGTPAGHNAGCRCTPCGAAKLAYDKRRKHELHTTGQRRVVPSYRAVRRIHALQALGFSVREIAIEAGLDIKTLYDTSLERSMSTWRRNFEPLAEAYERMCGTIPEGRYAGRNRRYAARQGWPPPLAWDDIDDPDEQPTDWAYVPPTRMETLLELVERGDGISAACAELKVSRATLQKWCGLHGVSHLYRTLTAREVRPVNQYDTAGREAS